jgi:hypothetical protein
MVRLGQAYKFQPDLEYIANPGCVCSQLTTLDAVPLTLQFLARRPSQGSILVHNGRVNTQMKAAIACL